MERFISVMKSIRSTIFSPKATMQKRISYAMVVCASFGELFGFIESYLIGLPKISYLLPLFSFIVLMALSLWGFKTKKTNLFATLCISITGLIILPLMFFANAGLKGGMAFYLMIAIVCSALALRGKTRFIIFILLLLEYSGLFAVYHFCPKVFTTMGPEEAFIDQLCSMIIASCVLFTFSFIVSKQNSHDRHMIESLSRLYERQANTDELTGLYNRRYFNNFLKLAILTLGDTGMLHIAMFDIDDFKFVNDKYGHPFGDVILRKFASLLKTTEKNGTTVCRYGGEEFLLLIPKKDKNEALEIVENILNETRTTIEKKKKKCITVSAGFVTCTAEMTYDVLLEEVDKKLYMAKTSGKNRVIQ